MPTYPLLARQDRGPCPGANGTTIGGVQQYNLFCGSDFEGDVLDTIDADTLPECVELCSFFHPRCTAISYSRAGRCRLKASIVPEGTRPSRFQDSAAALGPPVQPTSNCREIGGQQAVNGGRDTFDTFCNQIVNGRDLDQRHASTMQDCMGICGGTPGCSGISFDASMDDGFMNCYLKEQFERGELLNDQGIDSAVLNVGAPQEQPQEAPVVEVPQQQPPPPVVQAPPAQPPVFLPPAVVPPPTITALPQPVEGAVEQDVGPVFSITGFSTLVGAPSFLTLTEVIESTVISRVVEGNGGAATELVTIPASSITRIVANPDATGAPDGDAAGVGGEQQGQDDGGGDNLAWVAAPVIGGVAAILLVVVMFVLWGKKRKGGNEGGGLLRSPVTPLSPWVPPFIGNYWRAWSSGDRGEAVGDDKKGMVRLESPPASRGRGAAGGGGGGAGVIFDGQGSGKHTSVTVSGTSATAALAMIENSGGDLEKQDGTRASVYEVKGGKVELRNSVNGLRLNAPVMELIPEDRSVTEKEEKGEKGVGKPQGWEG